MILVLLLFGLLFLISATRGTDETEKLLELLKSDFTGKDNFFVWAIAIGGLYSLGLIKPLAKFASLFIILVFVVIIVRRKDLNGDTFFVSLSKQIRTTEG